MNAICKTMRRDVFLFLSLIVFFTLTGCGLASDGGQPSGSSEPTDLNRGAAAQVEFVDRLSGELYEYVQANRMEDALDKLEQLSREATGLQYGGITGSEGAEAFLTAVNQGKRALVRVHPSAVEIQLSAARIRLAADALNHPKQPMWLEYYRIMKDDITALEEAAEKKQFESYVRAFERLERHYSLLRPSMLINRDPSSIQQMDSLISYFRERQNDFGEMDSASFSYVISQLQLITENLFWQDDEPAFLPAIPFEPPLHWIVVIGSLILSVLAYVGWKKFRYEQEKVTRIKPGKR